MPIFPGNIEREKPQGTIKKSAKGFLTITEERIRSNP